MTTNRSSPSMRKRRLRRVRLDPQRRGFFVDGELRHGFADDPELPIQERRLIARWAARMAPEDCSDVQRALVREAEQVEGVSIEQRELLENQRELRSVYLSTVFDSLTERERELVRDPGSLSEYRDFAYPLSVGQMSALTQTTDRQIRRWADDGLLPSFRAGNERRFYSAALIRAFALSHAPHYTKALTAAAARGEVGQPLQLIAATIGRAATRMPPDLCRRFTALADELSSCSRLMSDVGDAKELQALWREIDLAAPAADEPRARTSWEEIRQLPREVGLEEAKREESKERAGSGATAVGVKIDSDGRVLLTHKGSSASRARASAIDATEADVILYAKYGGRKLLANDTLVLTAPRRKGEWVNVIAGEKRHTCVHPTKAEAEKHGRELARTHHAKHVVYFIDGSIASSHSYS